MPGLSGGPGFPGGPGFSWSARTARAGAACYRPADLLVLLITLLIAVVTAITIASWESSNSPSGPCIGGPVPGSTRVSVGNGNYRFDCVGGGSTIVHLGNLRRSLARSRPSPLNGSEVSGSSGTPHLSSPTAGRQTQRGRFAAENGVLGRWVVIRWQPFGLSDLNAGC